MVEQLEHITAMMRGRTAWAAVIPYTAGACAAMGGMLQLMEFEDAPPVAYTETSFSGTLLDDPAVVKRAQRAYALVESAAEDYRRCASTT